MTVAELLARISSKELTEWMVYFRLEPWGEERADLRQATTTAMLANVNRGKGTRVFTPWDFMPFVEKPKPSKDELAAKIKAALG